MTTSNSSDSPSPLSQVSPKSLNDIFSKDPELVTDEEIALVVQQLRADKARFDIEEKAPKKQKAPKVKLDPNAKIEDIGL